MAHALQLRRHSLKHRARPVSQYLEKGIPEIAEEISSYLSAHRKAADTLEGVAGWWITRHRVEESQQRVQEALDLLVRQGKVNCLRLSDGRLLYSLNESLNEGASGDG